MAKRKELMNKLFQNPTRIERELPFPPYENFYIRQWILATQGLPLLGDVDELDGMYVHGEYYSTELA